MAVPIKATLDRIPGGMLLVPLLIGSVVGTFAPDTAKFFGSFTGALFTGSTTILAVFYVCMGATIDVKSAPYILKKGGVLLGSKILFAVLIGLVAGHFLGELPIEGGFFAGLSTLALVAAFNDTNGGLYMALMKQYGKPKDVAAYSVMTLESGPFLTMVTLGVAGLSAFPWQTLLGAILPLLLGILLGNLDPKMREFLGAATGTLIPFFALALGFGLNLTMVRDAGLLGILLGLSVLIVGGVVMFSADKLTGGTGVAGLAAATTAGNAATVPALVAAANPVYEPAAGPATVLIAASVAVTAIGAPLMTAWWARRVAKRAPADETAAEEVTA